GHALGLEQRALAVPLGERAVRVHDPVPGHRGVVAGAEHRAGEARRAGGDVAVGAQEARGRVPDAGEHGGGAVHGRYPRAPMRPHGTYSIVARDPESGELGAAVQSHWFAVGSLCTWARPGIGAVATQSVVELAYGPAALDRMERGEAA